MLGLCYTGLETGWRPLVVRGKMLAVAVKSPAEPHTRQKLVSNSMVTNGR